MQRVTPMEHFTQITTQFLALPQKAGLLWGHFFFSSITSRIGREASFGAGGWVGIKMAGCVLGAFLSYSDSVFLCSSQCFITDRNH